VAGDRAPANWRRGWHRTYHLEIELDRWKSSEIAMDDAGPPPPPRDLDLAQLRGFVAVAEAGGVTRAARLLNRTQSAVSVQLHRLEAAVGRKLFRREGRSLSITPEGELLLQHARGLLRAGEDALAALGGERLAGAVRLGCMDDYAQRVIPALLAAFAAEAPEVAVEVTTGLTGPMLGELGRGFDLVLGMQPAGAGKGRVLRRDRPVWAAGPRFDAKAPGPLALALYPEGCLFRRWSLEALDRAGRKWRIAYLSPSLGAVEAAVAAGLAVSVFKAATLPAGLKRLGIREGFPPLPPVEIALHSAPRRLAPAAARLADFLARGLAPVSPN